MAEEQPGPAWVHRRRRADDRRRHHGRRTCSQELDEWLNAAGVSLVFAEMKDPVRAKIERYELTRTIDPAHFFPTVDEAVDAYIAETGAPCGAAAEEEAP